MNNAITFGIAPEEPDTILIGSGGCIWGRVVGSPDQPASERLRMLLACEAWLKIAPPLAVPQLSSPNVDSPK